MRFIVRWYGTDKADGDTRNAAYDYTAGLGDGEAVVTLSTHGDFAGGGGKRGGGGRMKAKKPRWDFLASWK